MVTTHQADREMRSSRRSKIDIYIPYVTRHGGLGRVVGTTPSMGWVLTIFAFGGFFSPNHSDLYRLRAAWQNRCRVVGLRSPRRRRALIYFRHFLRHCESCEIAVDETLPANGVFVTRCYFDRSREPVVVTTTNHYAIIGNIELTRLTSAADERALVDCEPTD